MKKICLFIILSVMSSNAWAECVENPLTYTSCKPGYYLSGTLCVVCPDGGTSADKNKNGIGACYLPTGSSFSDSTGSGEYTNNCYYGGSLSDNPIMALVQQYLVDEQGLVDSYGMVTEDSTFADLVGSWDGLDEFDLVSYIEDELGEEVPSALCTNWSGGAPGDTPCYTGVGHFVEEVYNALYL